jgi:O-antigen ligase
MPSAQVAAPQSAASVERLILGAIVAVWLVVALGGGSARADVLYLVPLRVAVVAGLAALLLIVPPDRLGLGRPPLLFTAAVALVIALQLVPLPHSLWTALPGREVYDGLAGIPEIGALWRPFSVAPDLTWNALLSLLPPLFFLIAVPLLGARYRRRILLALLATILVSALLGMLQIADGAESSLRWYQYSNVDSGTGLFANRNHQAVFLAMGIPLTVWWALSKSHSRRMASILAIAASIILFLLVAVATSQSRMGLVVVALSLLLSAVYFSRQGRASRRALLWGWSALVAVGLMLAASIAMWADNRLINSSIVNDLRIRILPESVETVRAFFPAGSGFGTFPMVFPRFESVEDLSPQYVNHTHSELTQIVIEGGLVSVLLLLLFLLWFAVRWVKAWRRHERNAEQIAEARLYTILIVLPLVGSITDYPLRAPLMACTFAALAALLHQSLRAPRARKVGVAADLGVDAEPIRT